MTIRKTPWAGRGRPLVTQQYGWRTSMICRAMLACLLVGMVVSPPSVRADESIEKQDRLRQEYQAARDTVAGKQEWDWEATKELHRSGQAFLTELVHQWAALPAGSADTAAVREEIQSVFNALAGCRGKDHVCVGCRATENFINQQSFLAGIAWPLLAATPLRTEQAELLAELTRPNFSVRLADGIARLGMPTERYGWDVQATHALALIRSGKGKKAQAAVKRLNRKVSMNELKGRLRRNYTNELQLCEVLQGLQAAVANDHEAARQHLENARQLRDDLSPQASPLAAEIERRLVGAPAVDPAPTTGKES